MLCWRRQRADRDLATVLLSEVQPARDRDVTPLGAGCDLVYPFLSI